MNILENISSAFANVLGNKMRSILTMLGIIIGISSVIMITSVGDGMKTQTSHEFSQMGMDCIILQTNRSEEISHSDELKLSDIETIRLVENVEDIAPVVYGSGTYNPRNPEEEAKRLDVSGVTKEYQYAQPMDLMYGRFINDMDVESRSNVIIIDKKVAKNIFGKEDVIGLKMNVSFWFGSQEFTIIGVYKGKDYGDMFEMPSSAYIPITSFMNYYANESVNSFYITVKDKTLANNTVTEISKLMDLSHRTTDKYSFQNLMNMTEQIDNVMGMVTSFIAFVAAISLLVGGIGVMNIMLVTVTERTREIGIRKSLGATDFNIQTQFLIESVILTLIGGAIGIVLGYIGGLAIGSYISITPVISLKVVTIVVLISSAIGIVFGVYPANKAAKLDPIEALRYE